MKNIAIVAHKFLTQPDDDYVYYLNRNKCDNVLHIRHSFSDAPDRCSYYSWYKNGVLYKEYRTADYQGWIEPFIYLKEFFFTLKWILLSSVQWDVYIGMDGLCIFWGNVLRSLGKTTKTVFWAIDFVPNDRFGSRIKNRIYHWINKQGYMRSDQMWDLSPRMAEAREKFLDLKRSSYRFHDIVPYGVWTQRIKKYRYNECEKTTLVFMGHLLEKQGVQLVIEAVPEIIKKISSFRFKIIGNGHYKENLTALAKRLNVAEYCDFKGKIEDHRELESEIARSCMAIAPYIQNLDTWTYYADPGKVKTYLACGVPVLLTDIPWNASDIESNNCGMIIREDPGDIADKIVMLMHDSEKCQQLRDNSIAYSQKFNYENIFNKVKL